MLVTCGSFPSELVLLRITNLMLATVIEIFDRIGSHSPFETLDVTVALTDSKHHMQHRPDAKETGECGPFVEPIQFVKVVGEPLVTDQLE